MTKKEKEEAAAKAAAANQNEETPTMSLELVDEETGSVMSLDDLGDAFKVDTTEGIKMLSNPREWRAKNGGAAGFFEVAEENRGKELKMNILGYRDELAFFGEAYGEEEEMVTQVVFIDPEQVVASMVLRKSVAEEFKKMVDNVMLKKLPLVVMDVTASMEKKMTKKGQAYYLVSFTAERMPEEKFNEIKAFVIANPKATKHFRTLPRK